MQGDTKWKKFKRFVLFAYRWLGLRNFFLPIVSLSVTVGICGSYIGYHNSLDTYYNRMFQCCSQNNYNSSSCFSSYDVCACVRYLQCCANQYGELCTSNPPCAFSTQSIASKNCSATGLTACITADRYSSMTGNPPEATGLLAYGWTCTVPKWNSGCYDFTCLTNYYDLVLNLKDYAVVFVLAIIIIILSGFVILGEEFAMLRDHIRGYNQEYLYTNLAFIYAISPKFRKDFLSKERNIQFHKYIPFFILENLFLATTELIMSMYSAITFPTDLQIPIIGKYIVPLSIARSAGNVLGCGIMWTACEIRLRINRRKKRMEPVEIEISTTITPSE